MDIDSSTSRHPLQAKDVNIPTSPSKQCNAKMISLASPSLSSLNQTYSAAQHTRKRPLEMQSISEPDSKKPKCNDVTSESLQRGSDLGDKRKDSIGPIVSRDVSDADHTAAGQAEPDSETVNTTEHMIDAPQSQDSTFSTSTTLVESIPEPSAAETLRLRLRYAMYKVRTDQIESPISRLEIDVPVSPSPTTPKPQLVIRDPPEETMRRFHGLPRRAGRSNDSRQRARQVLEPGPEIRSTPKYGPWEPDRSSPRYGPIVSPVWDGSEGGHGPYYASTPKPAAMSPSSQQSSPSPEPMYASPYTRGMGGDGKSRGDARDERDLLSSAIKGKAADSLLRLSGHS